MDGVTLSMCRGWEIRESKEPLWLFSPIVRATKRSTRTGVCRAASPGVTIDQRAALIHVCRDPRDCRRPKADGMFGADHDEVIGLSDDPHRMEAI